MGNSNSNQNSPTRLPVTARHNSAHTVQTHTRKLSSQFPTLSNNPSLDKPPLLPKNPNKRRSEFVKLDHIYNFDAPTSKSSNPRKTQSEKLLIQTALNQHFLFSCLSEDYIEKIIAQMHLYVLKPLEIVFFQGNPGNTFYIIAKGSVEIVINGHKKGCFGPGQSFGELALIHDINRTATVKSLEILHLWGLSRTVFRSMLKQLNTLLYEENKSFLTGVPFLQSLSDTQIEALVSECVNQIFAVNEKIVAEGDPGDIFFVIQEGVVECSAGGTVMRRLGKGNYFGEQALISNSLRTATVIAVTQVKVLSFSREVLNRAVGEGLQLFFYRNTLEFAFDRCQYLKYLSEQQKEEIFEKIEIFDFDAGQVVIPKGPVKGRFLWIVLKGVITDGVRVVQRLENIGAEWIYNEDDGVIDENFTAEGAVDIGMIKKEIFERVLGGKFAKVLQENAIVQALKQVYLFRILSESKLVSLSKHVKICKLTEGQFVFNQGDTGDEFYIINSGEVNILKDSKVIRTIAEGTYFGERSILMNETRTASAVCKTDAELWVLSREDFFSIVDESILNLLLTRIALQDDSILFEDLMMVDSLGKGTFGSVYLCVNKKTGVLYALKSITRKKIDAYDIHENLLLEKRILERVDHQFIVKFVKTFKDNSRMFLLMEYVQGRTLFEVLRVINVVNSAKCKFYASCLLLILEHLHGHRIIYRDLKPENIMVDQDGYLKLLDFGTAKLVDKSEERTFTVIGTAHYMAPEVILGKGYSYSADFWSLGIMIYEMLCGVVPFGKDSDTDPYTIYNEIISGNLNFPAFVTEPCKDIITFLLSKNLSNRVSSEKVKSHNWFVDVAWESILSRQKPAPYKAEAEDLSEAIREAIEQQKTITDYLLRIRESSGLMAVLSHRKTPSGNWDVEF